jgi:hypothetical protein
MLGTSEVQVLAQHVDEQPIAGFQVHLNRVAIQRELDCLPRHPGPSLINLLNRTWDPD